jgi:two-component system chemotaxis response regulator CheY
LSSNANSLNILVADDNAHMRAIVVAVLKGLGLDNVREAANGADALGILREWHPDVAIVDFRMDPIDGVEFTRLVRNAEGSANPYLPIIMLTGYADRVRVFEARDAGVTELIVKPVTAQAMIARLNAVIHHPRSFIRSEDYFGPCRRRTANPQYIGPERRMAGQDLQISA